MHKTISSAAVQSNNSTQTPPCKGRWRIVCPALIVASLAAAALFYWGRGVHLDEEFAAQTYQGMTTYYLNSSNHSNTSILYLTTGENDNGITDRQWRHLNQIANKTDAEIIIPDIYALSAADDEAIYENLYNWYVPWQHGNSSRIFYIAGDYTDSGLLTGFMDYLQAQGAQLPNGTTSIDEMTEILAE